MRFFFYGTLLQGSCNAVATELHALLRPLEPARVAGVLFAIPDPDGWYPALVLDDAGMTLGMIYETGEHFTVEDLARMDAYEDYDPADPDRSLYIRSEVAVMDGGAAQAYVWNGPLPERAVRIVDGDFRRWLADEGLPQFRGLRDT